MLKFLLFCSLFLVVTSKVYGYPGGSATCEINASYSGVFLMTDRYRNNNSGTYNVSANNPYYVKNEEIELTITGPQFIGIVFAVEDDAKNIVGTFNIDSSTIRDCNTASGSSVVTHTNSSENNNFVWNGTVSYTLKWIPPALNVGMIHVTGYVLKGSRISNNPPQEFFRFVQDDGSALSIQSRDVFTSGFE